MQLAVTENNLSVFIYNNGSVINIAVAVEANRRYHGHVAHTQKVCYYLCVYVHNLTHEAEVIRKFFAFEHMPAFAA